jgi:hypothetical protein
MLREKNYKRTQPEPTQEADISDEEIDLNQHSPPPKKIIMQNNSNPNPTTPSNSGQRQQPSSQIIKQEILKITSGLRDIQKDNNSRITTTPNAKVNN